MDDSLGTVDFVEGRLLLRFERRLAHPPEKVWRAITDPAEMAHWFPATVDVRPAAGAAMRFSFGDGQLDLGGTYSEGEVLEFDPPKVYAFRWARSVLRFELVADGDGCLLVFSELLHGTDTSGDMPSVVRQAPGWDACLDGLAALVDGRQAPVMPEGWFLSRAERYAAAFGLGEGEARGGDDGFVVRFERDLVPDRGRVWAALAEGDEPVAGATAPVRFTHGYVVAGEMTAVEPGRLAEYSWLHEGAPAGCVRFELRDQEPVGTRLVVTQSVPVRLAHVRATALAAWQTHLELFFAALYGDVRCPWPAERTEELRRYYEDRLRLGVLTETGDGRFALRYDRHLPHPPERVWPAVTDPEWLRAWFPADVEFDLRPGARLAFRATAEQVRRYGMPPDDVTYGEVLKADRPALLEYTWGDELLRWELSPDGTGGCHLVFTNIFGDRDIAASAGAGWHAGLDVLRAQLDGKDLWWSPFDRAGELAADYAGLATSPPR